MVRPACALGILKTGKNLQLLQMDSTFAAINLSSGMDGSSRLRLTGDLGPRMLSHGRKQHFSGDAVVMPLR